MAYLDTSAIVQAMLANNPQLQALLSGMPAAAAGGAPANPLAGQMAVDPISVGPTPTPAPPPAAAPAANPQIAALLGRGPLGQALATVQKNAPAQPAPTGPVKTSPHGWTDDIYGQRYAQGGGIDTSDTIQANASTLPGLKLEGESAASGKFGAGYLAKTNMGDTATSVNAADGARVQLIDPQNGQVVAEGVGPQGADYIASLATAISQKLGKQANWDIATETGKGTNQFTTSFGDRTDKPRFTLLSALKTVAPALVAMIPGVGTAIGTALGLSGAAATGVGSALAAGATGLATGQKPLQALLTAAGAGAGGYFGGAGGAGGAAGSAGGDFAGGLGNALGGLATDAGGWGAAAAGLGDVGLGTFGAGLGSALAGTGLGGLAGGLAGGGLGDSAGGLANGGSLPASATQGLGPNTVPELVVQGSKGGLGNLGVGASLGAGAGAALPNVVPELTVTAPKQPVSSNPSIEPATILGSIPGLTPSPSGGLDVKLDQQPNNLGKDIKSATDLIKVLLGNGQGGGGTSPSPRESRPGVTPMGPEGGGSGGGPGGGGTTTSPIPGVTPTNTGGGLGTPSNGGIKSPMAQVGAGTGGSSGVGVSGPGNLKLQGSLAPNIYPWMGGGGQAQQPTDQGTQGL